MWHPLKPETAARRARERAASQAEQHASLVRRLAEKAAADPERGEGIWAEMLAEQLAKGGR